MRPMTYVQRRANRLEFRYRLPEDLAGKPIPAACPPSLAPLINTATRRFKRELIKSLQTADANIANRRALPSLAEAQALVIEARRFLSEGPRSGITQTQIDDMIAAREIALLSNDEAFRAQGMGLDVTTWDFTPDGEGMTRDDVNLYKFVIRHVDGDLRAAAGQMRPPEFIKLAVAGDLESRGIALPPDDPARRKLELGYLAAQRRAHDIITARAEGAVISTPKPSSEAGAT